MKLLINCFLCVLIVLLSGLLFAGDILMVRRVPQKSDMIVVLSGETPERSMRALELYNRGFSNKILVSGQEDEKVQITKNLLYAGVPVENIIIENMSRNTYENSKNSSTLLNKWQVKSIILVTSWFHSRRATAAFRAVNPSMIVNSVPTTPVSIIQICNNRVLTDRVLIEYVKLVYYCIKYGINPMYSY